MTDTKKLKLDANVASFIDRYKQLKEDVLQDLKQYGECSLSRSLSRDASCVVKIEQNRPGFWFLFEEQWKECRGIGVYSCVCACSCVCVCEKVGTGSGMQRVAQS